RFDRPRSLNPQEGPADADPPASLALLKGLPGPSGPDLPPQASSALTPLWLKRRAPRPRGVRPCPHGNGFPWNAHRRFRWQGARRPRTEWRTRRLHPHQRRPSGSSPHTPDHGRCNGVACGGLKPQTVRKLKQQDGPDIHVYGSSNLIQTLLKHDLIDAFWLKICPITLGTGKRLFAEGTIPAAFKVAKSQVSPTGVVVANLERSGEVQTGAVGE